MGKRNGPGNDDDVNENNNNNNDNDVNSEAWPSGGGAVAGVPPIIMPEYLDGRKYVKRHADYNEHVMRFEEKRASDDEAQQLLNKITAFTNSNLTILDVATLKAAIGTFRTTQQGRGDLLAGCLLGLVQALEESLERKSDDKFMYSSTVDSRRVTIDWDNTGDMAIVDTIAAIGKLYDPNLQNLTTAASQAVQACEKALANTDPRHPATKVLAVIPGIIALAVGMVLGLITAMTFGWMAYMGAKAKGNWDDLCSEDIVPEDKIDRDAFNAGKMAFLPSRLLYEAGLNLLFNTAATNKGQARSTLAGAFRGNATTPEASRQQQTNAQPASSSHSHAATRRQFLDDMKNSQTVKTLLTIKHLHLHQHLNLLGETDLPALASALQS